MKKIILSLLLLLGTILVHSQDLYINVFGDSKNQPIIFLHGEPGYNCANFEATPTQQLTNHNFYVIVYDRRGKEEARLLQQHTFFKNPSTI